MMVRPQSKKQKRRAAAAETQDYDKGSSEQAGEYDILKELMTYCGPNSDFGGQELPRKIEGDLWCSSLPKHGEAHNCHTSIEQCA